MLNKAEESNRRSLVAKIARLEKKLKIAEDELKGYVFIDKKPDYYYSFSGSFIFRKWYLHNGLTGSHAELIVLLSYIDIFLTDHFKLYTRSQTRIPIKYAMQHLVDQRYVIKIKVQGKSRSSLRNGWVLTQRGKDLEADYERFYDNEMKAIKKGEVYTFNFEDGVYYRKVKLSAFNRRILQGGGKLPVGESYTKKFVEPEVLTKRYGEA